MVTSFFLRGPAKRHSVSILLGLFATALTVTLFAAPKNPLPGGNAKISWSRDSLTVVAPIGTLNTFPLSFVASENLSNVALRVVPELQTFIKVFPATFEKINAGEEVAVIVTVTSSPAILPQVISGTIQLRNTVENSKNIPNPLSVKLNLQWQQFANTNGFFFIYPPTYILSSTSGSKLEQVTFSENQTSIDAGIAPTLVITLYPLPIGPSIRDRIHSFGVSDQNIEEVLIGQNTFLKWSETGGIADESSVSYSILAPNNRMLTFNVVGSLTPALENVIASLTFSAP